MLGQLWVQRWPCKACLGSALPLPPGVTSRQRPQSFQELEADLYVHCVSFRGLSRLLAQRGVRGLTTDDDPVYGPTLEAAGLDRPQCVVHMQRTVHDTSGVSTRTA